MIKIKRQNFCFLGVLMIFAFLVVPALAGAQGFLVCDDQPKVDPQTGKMTLQDPCDFEDLIELAINIIKYLILISIPLASISFVWAGVTYITAQGSQGKIDKAHQIFKMTLIGFVFILAAWLIVYTIGKALLDPSSFFLQIFNSGRPN